MSAAFPPRPDHEQARDWLKRRLAWEDLLTALRAGQRGEEVAAERDLREAAAA
jgi:hypothetical protein